MKSRPVLQVELPGLVRAGTEQQGVEDMKLEELGEGANHEEGALVLGQEQVFVAVRVLGLGMTNWVASCHQRCTIDELGGELAQYEVGPVSFVDTPAKAFAAEGISAEVPNAGKEARRHVCDPGMWHCDVLVLSKRPSGVFLLSALFELEKNVNHGTKFQPGGLVAFEVPKLSRHEGRRSNIFPRIQADFVEVLCPEPAADVGEHVGQEFPDFWSLPPLAPCRPTGVWRPLWPVRSDIGPELFLGHLHVGRLLGAQEWEDWGLRLWMLLRRRGGV